MIPQLRRHVRKPHIICESCEFVTVNDHKLGEHVRAEHPDRYEDFKKKLEEEARERGKLFVCDKCALTFHSKMSFSLHLRTHAVTVNMLKCHLCEYTSPSDVYLRNHIERKHEGSYRYVGHEFEFCIYALVPNRSYS